MKKIQGAKTIDEMRANIRSRAKIGKEYELWIRRGESSRRQCIIIKDWYTLVAIYPYIVTFRSRKGVLESFPLYEAIHLMNGEKFTSAGLYGNTAQGIIPA